MSEPEECHAARDGECNWSRCPQVRDNEPRSTGRHCPLDSDADNYSRQKAIEVMTLSGAEGGNEQPAPIPDDLRHQYFYAKRCMDEDEPFGYGPLKVVTLIERIGRVEAGNTTLRAALSEITTLGPSAASFIAQKALAGESWGQATQTE